MSYMFNKDIKPLNENSKILVTGGAGFLGSCLIYELNQLGINNIDICDNLGNGNKWLNIRNLDFRSYIEKDKFEKILEKSTDSFTDYDYIFHFGGTSDINEENMPFLLENNYNFTCKLFKIFISRSRIIYASTIDTYGKETFPFSDDERNLKTLKPINKLAYCKYLIDREIFKSDLFKENIVGLKYSKVFGVNEYHKKNKSIILNYFNQIMKNNYVNIDKSYDSNIKDGEQWYDFIYVKNAIQMTLFFGSKNGLQYTGIYNVGSGYSLSLNKIARLIFKKLNIKEDIRYVDIPEEKRKNIINYNCLDIQKINNIMQESNYIMQKYSFEEALDDYIDNYLLTNKNLGD